MRHDDIRDINKMLTKLDEPIRSPQQRRRNGRQVGESLDKYDPEVQVPLRRKSIKELGVVTSYVFSGALVAGGLGTFLVGTEWGAVDKTALVVTVLGLIGGGAIAGRQIGLRSLRSTSKK